MYDLRKEFFAQELSVSDGNYHLKMEKEKDRKNHRSNKIIS
jgi:hypothetical protein